MRRVLIFSFLTITLAASCRGETVMTFDIPEIHPAPEMYRADEGNAEEEASGFEEIKIGGFERPDIIPEYDIIEQNENRRDGVRAMRLLVDTKVVGEAAYELIARDIKARYAEYDAVSAEVTDTSTDFDYNGAILIFNTPEGSYYMGFLYSPPNNRGYVVDVAE